MFLDNNQKGVTLMVPIQDIPTRELYWNISASNFLYLFFLIALAIFAYGFYKQYQSWKLGKTELRKNEVA